jgi:pterin-4a-carbinolamine dehydratase
MSEAINVPEGWARHERPPNLFRRFTFGSYGETRGFLDRLAALSEETGYYPDIGFGTGYANVTIHARDGTALGAADLDFARRVSALAPPGAGHG